MKNTKILLLTSLMLGGLLVGCDNNQTTSSTSQNDSPYAFDFVGKGKTGGGIDTSEYPYKPIEGVDFTVSIKGLKLDRTVELTVKEAPQIVIGGTYEYIENKGYKLYLEDVSNTFVYTNYNVDTKTFSFSTTLIFNSAIGFFDATYTYVDESFASIYDGVGFNIDAPVYECAVSVMPGGKCLLKTNDKGEFTWYGLSGMGGDYSKRYGTWRFDSSNNEYIFNFNDGVFKHLSTLWMTINWSEANIETYRHGDTNGLENYPEEASSSIDNFNAYLETKNYFEGEIKSPYNSEKNYYYINFAMMNILGTDLTSGAPGWAFGTYTK